MASVKEKRYKCFDCNRTFSPKEMKSEKVPSNFMVMGSKSNNTGKVDQCPHCDAVAFLGFREVT